VTCEKQRLQTSRNSSLTYRTTVNSAWIPNSQQKSQTNKWAKPTHRGATLT